MDNAAPIELRTAVDTLRFDHRGSEHVLGQLGFGRRRSEPTLPRTLRWATAPYANEMASGRWGSSPRRPQTQPD